jgi:hypothetical protein
VNEYVAGSQAYPSAATLADGRLIVVWQSDGQDGAGGGIYGRVVEAD